MNFLKSCFWTFFMLVFAFAMSYGQKHSFDDVISKFVSDKDFKGASIGIALIDLETGKLVGSHQRETILIPASVMKIFSTSAALDQLGPDYRFKTVLSYSGSIENGTLKGDLIVKGQGDPTLGSSKINNGSLDQLLAEIVKAIKALSITNIEGRIIVDGSFYGTTSVSPHWNWADLGNYYGGGAWGINVADNEFSITFKQSSQLGESPAIIKIEPSIPGMTLLNEVKSGPANSGDNAYIFGAPYQSERIVRGTIPLGKGLFTIKGSMPDPARFLSQTLRDHLLNNGIKILGDAVTDRDITLQRESDLTPIKTLLSPELREIIKVINKHSNNLYAESLFRMIAQSKESDAAMESNKVMEKWMKSFTGDEQPVWFYDGVGLSRSNGVSAYQTALLLYRMTQKPYFQNFSESLASPGEEGTFRNIFKDMPPRSSFKGKSGSIQRVRSYAGYLEHMNGKKYAFAVICNNFDANYSGMTKKLERLIYELVSL